MSFDARKNVCARQVIAGDKVVFPEGTFTVLERILLDGSNGEPPKMIIDRSAHENRPAIAIRLVFNEGPIVVHPNTQLALA